MRASGNPRCSFKIVGGSLTIEPIETTRGRRLRLVAQDEMEGWNQPMGKGSAIGRAVDLVYFRNREIFRLRSYFGHFWLMAWRGRHWQRLGIVRPEFEGWVRAHAGVLDEQSAELLAGGIPFLKPDDGHRLLCESPDKSRSIPEPASLNGARRRRPGRPRKYAP
jgi:hypothetical protein